MPGLAPAGDEAQRPLHRFDALATMPATSFNQSRLDDDVAAAIRHWARRNAGRIRSTF
jgi:hypothetical protein